MSFKDLAEKVVKATSSILGEEITYTPTVGDPATIKGVFDNAWVDINGIQMLKPVLRLALADLESAPAKNDTVTVSGTTYKVQESRVDGFGGTTLILQKS